MELSHAWSIRRILIVFFVFFCNVLFAEDLFYFSVGEGSFRGEVYINTESAIQELVDAGYEDFHVEEAFIVTSDIDVVHFLSGYCLYIYRYVLYENIGIYITLTLVFQDVHYEIVTRDPRSVIPNYTYTQSEYGVDDFSVIRENRDLLVSGLMDENLSDEELESRFLVENSIAYLARVLNVEPEIKNEVIFEFINRGYVLVRDELDPEEAILVEKL